MMFCIIKVSKLTNSKTVNAQILQKRNEKINDNKQRKPEFKLPSFQAHSKKNHRTEYKKL